MSDASLGSFGFDVNTAGLRAGSDELTRFEGRTNAASEALAKMEARAASAFSKVSSAVMSGSGTTAGPGSTTAETAAQAGLATATNTSTAAISNQAVALRSAAAAHSAHGAASYANRMQMLELAHVGRAVFDEMAAGGNVFRALAMEGGRLQVALGSGEGGITGLMTRLGGAALGFVNPVTLGATAVVGFGAAAVLATSHIRALREELNGALSGVGHFSGLSTDGLDALARQSAASTGLPLDAARSAAERMAATGKLDGAGISGGLGMVRGYAATFGTNYDEAGDKLADIFADPVRGADKLNERLGFLTDATRQYIRALQDQGDASAAAQALQAAAAPSLAERVKPPSTLDRLKGWYDRRNEEIENTISHAFGDYTPAERLAASERDAQNRAMMGITRFDPNSDPSILSENMRRASQLKELQQETIAGNRMSLQAGSVIGRIDPDAGRYFDLVNQQKLLHDTMNSPTAAAGIAPGMSDGKLLSGSDLLADSFAKVSDKLVNFMSSTERATLATNANVLGISAWTLGEHLAAATAQEMAALGIRQIKTSEELIAVQSKQAEIIAHANDKAFNLARDAADNLSIAGLSGLDRTRAQIDLKYRDYHDQLADTSVGSDFEGIGAAFLPAKTAATGFASALDGATARLAAFPGGGGPGPSVPIYGSLKPMADPTPYAGPVGGVSDHQRQLVKMLVDAGYPQAGSIGFVGGLTGESTSALDPLARNATGHRGIAQWDGPRYAALAATGDATDFQTQARFIIRELGGPESIAAAHLRAATTIKGGLEANFQYERPSNAEILSSYGRRLAAGEKLGADIGGLSSTDRAAMTIHGAGASAAVLGVKLDTAGYLSDARRDSKAAANIDAGESILTSASNSLASRAAAFDELSRASKMSTAELARYVEVSKLQLQLDQQHVEISPKMRDKMRALGDTAARLAQQQQDLGARREFMGSLGSDVSSVLSAGAIGAATGHGFMNPARQALSSIGQSLIHSGFNSLTGSIFGTSKSDGFLSGLFGGGGGAAAAAGGFGSYGPQLPGAAAGGSGLGGILGSLIEMLPHFAGGTQDAPGGLSLVGEDGPELVQMPAHAQVISSGGLPGAMAAMNRGHTFNFGAPVINVQGDVSEANRSMILQAVASGNRQVIDHVTRNLPQIIRDNGQSAN